MDTFEFSVDESLRPSVERKLTGSTKIDRGIASQPLFLQLRFVFVNLYLSLVH